MDEPIDLTENDLLQLLINQLALGEQEDAGFLTMQEIADAMGLHTGTVQRRLQKLHRQGRIEVRQVYKPNIVGAMQRRPAYRLRQAADEL